MESHSQPPASGAGLVGGDSWISAHPNLSGPPASPGRGIPIPALPGMPGRSQVPQAAALSAHAVLRVPGGAKHAVPDLPAARALRR